MGNAAVGFRVHPGWATAVLLVGTATAPEAADSRIIKLSDPAVPGSQHPFHAGLDLPKGEAGKAVALLVKAVERFARRSLLDLYMAYRSAGHHLSAAGIVVDTNIDPATLEDEDARASAEEERLFRTVIQNTSESRGLVMAVTATVEEEIFDTASRKLGIPVGRMKETVGGLGRKLGGAWRTEETAAALAAWVGLLRRR